MTGHRRVLLIGGSGWIGTALQQVLAETNAEVLVTSSRESITGDDSVLSSVREFEPNAVVFLAGVTPDLGPSLGLDAYERALDRVTQELRAATRLVNLQHFTYLSSGIAGLAIATSRNPYREAYRRAKLDGEALAADLSASMAVSTIRVFSLSGPFARDPGRYALFDLISQAKMGRIELTSERLVYRSYVGVLDLARAIARSLAKGISGLYYTGGERIELESLAGRIASLVNPSALVVSPQDRAGVDDYTGPNADWLTWCDQLGFAPQGLPEQILASYGWLFPDE